MTGGQNGGEETSLHVGRLLNHGDFLELSGHGLQQCSADLRVGHLTAAEHNGHFDLVTALEELLRVARLHLQVVRIYLGPHANLTQDGGVLGLAGLTFLLRLLILELTVVEQSAYWGHCVRRYFDQVQVVLARHVQGLGQGYNTQPLTIGADE